MAVRKPSWGRRSHRAWKGFRSGEQGAPFAHGMRGTQCAVLSSGSCGLRGRWALSGRPAISTGHLRLARPLWARKAPAARPAVAGPRGHVGLLGLCSFLSVTVHSGVGKTRLSPVLKRLRPPAACPWRGYLASPARLLLWAGVRSPASCDWLEGERRRRLRRLGRDACSMESRGH